MPAKGTAARGIQWAQNNLQNDVAAVTRWNSQAPGEWCGIFLGSLMRAQGIRPPKGYPAAANWAEFGTKVNSLSEAQPGDVLVYGHQHVAMYLGNQRQIQGNDIEGKVGESGLGPGEPTAIRRPPWKGKAAEGPLEQVGGAVNSAAGAVGSAFSTITHPEKTAEEVVSDLVSMLAEHAEPLMLNIALLGLGAFFIYYGAALMLGVKKPVATPLEAATATKGAAP